MYPKILIFGFGYTASILAKELLHHHFSIIGTTRQLETHPYFHSTEYKLIQFSKIDIEKHLRSVTHMLISTPPSAVYGDPVLAFFTDLIKEYARQFHWIGYLSSTGVYGDHQGKWVDESSSSLSPGHQGQLRLQAEEDWTCLAKEYRLPLHIFRISGIYGPNRNALTRIVRGKSETIYKKDHFFSRIHVGDLASTLIASMQKPNPISIYNVADDKPAPSYELDEYAACLLNLPAPVRIPFEEAVLSPLQKEFYSQNRRVSNTKIKQELSVTLKYPNYQEGLMALYQGGEY